MDTPPLRSYVFSGGSDRLLTARLIAADLQKAGFVGANLKGANLRGAGLRGAFLTAAELQIADLRGANLLFVEGLTQEQIELALGDNETKLPEILDWPDAWNASTNEQLGSDE